MKRIFLTITFLSLSFFIMTGSVSIYDYQNKKDMLPHNMYRLVYREIEDIVKKGETLFDIFKKNNLSMEELFELRVASADVYRLRNLHPGRLYKILVDEEDRINSFSYWIDDDYILNILRSESGFSAEKAAIPYEKKTLYIGGTVKDNLISSIGEGGEDLMLALKVSDIFAWDIDFTTDLRNGDIFRIIIEGLYLHGEFKKYGDVLSAEFINNGKSYHAYRFEHDGRAEYYDEEGKSLRRAFLKAPLSFRRISSTFSTKRYHPILKKYRPHHGLDYSAPAGTPVSAIGNGTIFFSGVKGQYGKLIIIRHPNGYKTYYGHLSKIHKGIKRGVKVEQGQLIGYVGSTGLATGPHLHYELRINNKPVNPLSIKLPYERSIPGELMADFNQFKIIMDEQLASIQPPVIGIFKDLIGGGVRS